MTQSPNHAPNNNGSTDSASSTDTNARLVDAVVVRFAGDSGDGMQLAGTQFTDTSALVGNDVATLPDYPAEIRAPQGTVGGVSGFQVNFASTDIHTPGDAVDVLIAMNPAALKAHVVDVIQGGTVIVNEDEFTKVNLKKAKYAPDADPLNDLALTEKVNLIKVPISRLNQEALAESGLGNKEITRCKNMWALGLVYWLFDRPLDPTINRVDSYFGKKKNMPEVAAANINALKSGYNFGETAELFQNRYQVGRADMPAGKYRKITGNEALALGLTAAGHLADKQVVYCSYPITPASTILHGLANLKHHNVKTFQAEDEIAAVCAAIGVSYTGQLGVTGTSGPGLALKAEAMGLATITELPLVIVNVQRGGPSTGLPTKTEQSDLLQALYGRNGDCPMVVLAPSTPADCFYIAIEASRIAMQHMVPVVILSDGYLGNGSEPWQLPTVESLKPITISHPEKMAAPTAAEIKANPELKDVETYKPYARDENLARPWAVPGTEGLMHRVGGLEKQNLTGNVAYGPDNHQQMVALRQAKVDQVANFIEDAKPYGDSTGKLLVLGWGGTYGSIRTAVEKARAQGKSVSGLHLKHISPMPQNLGEVLKGFDRILMPELNDGQLRLLIRGKFLVDARGLNKIQGKPFLVDEIMQAIDLMLEGDSTGGAFGHHESLMPREGVVSVENQTYDFTVAAAQ